MDLIFRRANLPDGRTGIDLGIEGDRIVAVEPQLQATAAEEIDAEGRLLSAPFVDAHFHMDATLSLGLPRMNRSGTLLEGIALWGELKPQLTHEAVVARALVGKTRQVDAVPQRLHARRRDALLDLSRQARARAAFT